MATAIRGTRKSNPKRGRPKTTGTGLALNVRMHDRQLALIDAWIAAQRENLSRPEAIRQLVAIALKSSAR